MKLSIIIPAYNVENYLPKCLDSILTQEYHDYEVIVVNDGSTDGTQTLLEKYACEYAILRIITQANSGMSTARNRGLQEAQGEYVWYVDSDDWLCENALTLLSSHLDGEDVICFNAQKYLEDKDAFVKNYRPTSGEIMSGWTYFNQQRLLPTEIHFVCIWQRVYRRQFLIDHNLNFVEGIRRAEDDLFSTLVMYYANTLKAIDLCFYVYRVRPCSITTTVNIDRWYDSLRVQEILANFFIPMEGIEKSVLYRVLASNYINYFSADTLNLYGNQDKYLTGRINWNYFATTAITKRHKRLYRLIKFSPMLFRLYCFLTTKLH